VQAGGVHLHLHLHSVVGWNQEVQLLAKLAPDGLGAKMDILPRDAFALLPHVFLNAPDDTASATETAPASHKAIDELTPLPQRPLVTIQPYLAAAAAEALRVYF